MTTTPNLTTSTPRDWFMHVNNLTFAMSLAEDIVQLAITSLEMGDGTAQNPVVGALYAAHKLLEDAMNSSAPEERRAA